MDSAFLIRNGCTIDHDDMPIVRVPVRSPKNDYQDQTTAHAQTIRRDAPEQQNGGIRNSFIVM
jgi:hypothetical protein